MNAQKKQLDALHPDEQALLKLAEQILNKLQRVDASARQALYLNAWGSFYDTHRNYLFPDDRAASEFGPGRAEDVGALSYERTEYAVKQTRAEVLAGNKERLELVLSTATDPTTYRNKLAHECNNTANRLYQYTDLFAELDAQTYAPQLPRICATYPDRRVDEPANVGAALGLLDFLEFVLTQFWANATSIQPSKGTPAADVRRYFPAVATIHGSTATDTNALHQLAVWLLHWIEHHGHRPASNEYSLAGRLREQRAAHPHAGKFLKACRRLHEALLPLAADEKGVKQLLGSEYGPHSRTNLAAVLKWWAGWIKEQHLAHDDPAGAYLAALRRVPVVEEWENGSPRYNLPTHLGIYEEFEAEITPLRQAFEAALPDLPTKKKRALRAGLNELLGIDRVGVQRRREQFERGEYGLDFLPADYPALRFDVAGQQGGFKWQWVSPMFWGSLSTLLQYKQMAARAACEQLAAALPEAATVAVVPDATDYYKNLGMPAPIKQIYDAMQADRLVRAQIELIENQAKAAKQHPAELPLLTPATTRTLYLKLLEHSALVGELNAYQKSELRAYAEGEQLSVTRLAVELMDDNPNYNYPAGYLNGREVEYWQGTISSYADSERVLRLLAPPAPATPTKVQAATGPPQTVTVAELCLASFTPTDLNELLVRLAVLDTGGNCLTNDLRGKARGRRGAFTAAYRVLHRAELLAPTATNKEWASAFSREYGAELGADVIAHKLAPNGQAARQTPAEFQRAVADAAEWVTEWKSRR